MTDSEFCWRRPPGCKVLTTCNSRPRAREGRGGERAREFGVIGPGFGDSVRGGSFSRPVTAWAPRALRKTYRSSPLVRIEFTDDRVDDDLKRISELSRVPVPHRGCGRVR